MVKEYPKSTYKEVKALLGRPPSIIAATRDDRAFVLAFESEEDIRQWDFKTLEKQEQWKKFYGESCGRVWELTG